MRSILKREVKNYMKNPLLWLGIAIDAFYGISKCKPLSEHPLSQGRGNHCE